MARDPFDHQQIAFCETYENRVYYVTKTGHVYRCGVDESGVFRNKPESYDKEYAPQLVSALYDECIVQIVCANSATAFLTSTGKVYTCGLKNTEMLCYGVDGVGQYFPRVVDLLLGEPINFITTNHNRDRLCFLTLSNEIYITNKNRLKKVKRCFEARIDKIMFFGGQLIVKTEKSDLYCCDYEKELHLSSGKDLLFSPFSIYPHKVDLIVSSARDSLTFSYSRQECLFITTTDGILMTSGFDPLLPEGKQPPCSKLISINLPVELRLMGIQKIVSNGRFAAFLMKNGAVYICGHLNIEMLGLSTTDVKTYPFYPVIFKSKVYIKDVFLSDSIDCIAFVTADGVIYTAGFSSSGKLGIESKNGLVTPNYIETLVSEKITQVCFTKDNAIFITEVGYVYTCGHSIHSVGYPIETLYKKVIIPERINVNLKTPLASQVRGFNFFCGMGSKKSFDEDNYVMVELEDFSSQIN